MHNLYLDRYSTDNPSSLGHGSGVPPEIEAQLEVAAASSGKTPQQFVQDSISYTLQRRAEFVQAVEEGISAANRGEFLDHKEALKQLSRIL